MTPAARIQAAIGLLDRIGAGQPAEQALTTWARTNRYAGSGDRAEVRDLVFRALRCRRSLAALGGGSGGRALMIGALREDRRDPAELFTGEGYGPAPLDPAEQAVPPAPVPGTREALDCPDWLAPLLEASLGAEFAPVMAALRHRAPVFLRVNLARLDREAAMRLLADEGIVARPHPLAGSALEVTENARRLQNGDSYRQGAVELQDAASQAVVEMLPLGAGGRVLDLCAGGGGKALAMAALAAHRGLALQLCAHDADAGRMRDLPARATRAGATVQLLAPGAAAAAGPFDGVLADVPCSGSGSWRRAPEAKWALTPDRLQELCDLQARILSQAAALVAPGGWLGYATCSMLSAENGDQVAAFLDATPGWRLEAERRFTPLDGGDGFYCAVLRRGGAI